MDIEERPAVVARRTRYWDWEADLIQGGAGSGFLLSVYERKSRSGKLHLLSDKSSAETMKGIVTVLYGLKVNSITYDNGLEFAKHELVNELLECESNFCKPYRSWEMGGVENHNGLVRQHFPKGHDFATITPERLLEVEEENPFDIMLSGQALSVNDDTDTDGLNDAAEYLMSALGYNWQVSQPALVNTLKTNANVAGLYTQTQVQAIHLDVPLLTKDPATGKFKLTLGIGKSTNLTQFTAFPFTVPDTSINGQGKLEFEFTSPDNAAFFRLQAQRNIHTKLKRHRVVRKQGI